MATPSKASVKEVSAAAVSGSSQEEEVTAPSHSVLVVAVPVEASGLEAPIPSRCLIASSARMQRAWAVGKG